MFRDSMLTIVKSTALGMALLIAPAFADNIPKEIYQKIDSDYSPALCRITYAIESTNNNTGATSRRASYAMGILVSEEGLILANGHMLLENRKPVNIKITVGSGDDEKEYRAVYLKKPDDINVTFLQIETDEDVTFPYIEFDTEFTLKLGDPFLNIGLLSANFDYAKTIQFHRVGAVLTDPRLTYTVDDSVGFGFMGGPVISEKGLPIGVIGFDLSRNEGGEIYTRSGYPIVYQASLFQRYIDNPDLISDKGDAYLGVFTQPLTEDYAEYWKLPKEGGIIVSTVISGSPAYKAGFKSGDVITRFNDQAVTAKQDQDVVSFTKMVRESPIDKPLPIKFYRGGKPMELKLTLANRPTAGKDASEFEDEIFGITARELTTDVRIQLNFGDEVQGVIIRAIKSGSPASLARLRRNYVIQAIGEIPVRNLDDFKKAIEQIVAAKPQEIPVFCRVGANTAFFRMRPRWDK